MSCACAGIRSDGAPQESALEPGSVDWDLHLPVAQVDQRDAATPDAWIPRHPELIRLTGRCACKKQCLGHPSHGRSQSCTSSPILLGVRQGHCAPCAGIPSMWSHRWARWCRKASSRLPRCTTCATMGPCRKSPGRSTGCPSAAWWTGRRCSPWMSSYRALSTWTSPARSHARATGGRCGGARHELKPACSTARVTRGWGAAACSNGAA